MNTTTKKPKSKRIQQDVPSLFFILSSFAKSKKASLPKSSSTNNGEEDVINCDKVLQEVNNLSIELPELSQSSTSITHADPLLSPDCGWWVSPTYEDDYAQCFSLWDNDDVNDTNAIAVV